MRPDVPSTNAIRRAIVAASARFGYDGLPTALRRYIILISRLGPALALAIAIARWTSLSFHDLLLASMLLVLAAIAERFPLHLTHKTNINVTAGAIMVMVLLLPAWLPGLLVLAASSLAQALRRTEPMEALFNIGQTVLYVMAATWAVDVLNGWHAGPDVGGIGYLGGIIAASIVMHLVNTGLVAMAGALQLGLNPFRVWFTTLALDWMPHITLCGLGVMAALLAADMPLILPVLALPVVLVHHSVRQTIQLRVDTHEALASLVEVMELRDPYTAGHSRRVASLSRTLALRLGMTAEEADIVEQAGRVHDIGKTALDSTILTKSGELTDAEWEQMRMHPVHGANVVARFAAYQNGALVVRHHHEAWDGSGYPDGLAGEAIPLGARIIAVADTFDAMTTNRPYRDGMSIAKAIEVLEGGAGRQWDARVVGAIVDWLGEQHGELPAFRAGGVPLPAVENPIESPRGAVVTVGME
jgi:HD-GYP domain-containing protein (c-di-GMP phosphodiesterase class II)